VIDDPEIPRIGVTRVDADEAQWCVWAPKAREVELELDGPAFGRVPMEPFGRGFHRHRANRPAQSQRYFYRLDGGERVADPCSRWQPDGIQGASAVWFPNSVPWDEGRWNSIDRPDLVFYELHVGTFTPEGTFESVIPRLDALRTLGITAIELMPAAQCPGTRSWGYDTVYPFAPQNSYGGPEALERLVAACHRAGLAIFLDVIYNHFGPEGNVFPRFGDYVTDRYRTDWGPALNFDGRGSDAVRAMVLENVRQWIRDYRFDGLRLDAADQIYDQSPRHILAEIAEVAHTEGGRLGRNAYVFAETDLNNATRFLHPVDRGGYGLDGQWNDDFQHAVHVTLTGETNGYYTDFVSGPRALAKVLERVFANDGNYSRFRDRRHGTTANEFPGDRFVAFTQNHDQVGNRLRSDRYAAYLASSAVRLAAGILLLSPRLPLLFMGEEYGETRPFPFFCDFESEELIAAVRAGRKSEFAYFGWDGELPDPFAPATRDSAVLSWSWQDPVREGLRRLYADLLRLRRDLPDLRDMTHPRTRLYDEGGDVLEVLRGARVCLIFNLAPHERVLASHRTATGPLLRSESMRYGGKVAEDAEWDGCLRPHEFVVFDRL
jgi:maltooligosyltrehalose trehalohydrolase